MIETLVQYHIYSDYFLLDLYETRSNFCSNVYYRAVFFFFAVSNNYIEIHLK